MDKKSGRVEVSANTMFVLVRDLSNEANTSQDVVWYAHRWIIPPVEHGSAHTPGLRRDGPRSDRWTWKSPERKIRFWGFWGSLAEARRTSERQESTGTTITVSIRIRWR